MYTFPDSLRIIAEAVEQTSAEPMFFRPAQLSGDYPIAVIYGVGGTQSGVLSRDTIAIDVYAEGRDDAYAAAEEIRQHLAGKFHYSEEYGLVDLVLVDTSPYQVPYLHDTVTHFTATYLVDTRAI